MSFLGFCATASVWACPGCLGAFASLLVTSAVLEPEWLSVVFIFHSINCYAENLGLWFSWSTEAGKAGARFTETVPNTPALQYAGFQLGTELSCFLSARCWQRAAFVVFLQLADDSVVVSEEVLQGSLSEQFCGFVSDG